MSEPPRISVFVDGRRAHWQDGAFHGDPDIVAEAELSVTIGAQFRLGYADVSADAVTDLGIAAALASFSPGRTRFLELPDEVGDFLYAGHRDPDELAAPGEE